MRLLDRDAARLDLDSLGMSRATCAALRASCSRGPHGIMLVTGPDRLGQDHHALRRARRDSTTTARNIITVEDPVEYQLDGISQIQVNPRIGLTFAAACARSCARTRT